MAWPVISISSRTTFTQRSSVMSSIEGHDDPVGGFESHVFDQRAGRCSGGRRGMA